MELDLVLICEIQRLCMQDLHTSSLWLALYCNVSKVLYKFCTGYVFFFCFFHFFVCMASLFITRLFVFYFHTFPSFFFYVKLKVFLGL